MNEGRLWYVGRRVKLRQKCCTASNDKIKESYRVLCNSVDKNKKSTSFRSWQEGLGLKWSYTKGRGLQKCLKQVTRSEFDREESAMYGRYNGIRLASLNRNVQEEIAYNHPKERRKRELEKYKSEGEKYGIITDYTDTLSKLENILERPSKYKVHLDEMDFSNSRRPRLRPRQSRRRLQLPPMTVSRKNLPPRKLFSLAADPLPMIDRSRSSTLLSF